MDFDKSNPAGLSESSVQAAIEGGTAEFGLEGLVLAPNGVDVIRSFTETDGKFCLNYKPIGVNVKDVAVSCG